jgi:hypothetical protein
MTQGSSLSGRPAAVHGGLDRVLSGDTAKFKRELNNLPQGQSWEGLLQRLIIDRNVACRPGDPGSGNRALSSSGCILSYYCHATTSPSSLAVMMITE